MHICTSMKLRDAVMKTANQKLVLGNVAHEFSGGKFWNHQAEVVLYVL